MIRPIWETLAYMIQLIGACLIFMAPVRKRRRYPLRVAGCSAALLLFSLAVSQCVARPGHGPALLAYWALFLVLCVPFVWLCIESRPVEAVYCTLCASAMQHMAYDLYAIYRLAGGSWLVVYGAIYLAVYLLVYWFLVRKIAGEERYVVGKGDLFPMLTIVLFVLLLSTSIRTDSAAAGGSLDRGIFLLSDALCCFYVLWQQAIQREKLELQRDLDGIHYAWHQQQLQFQMTQQTIDVINQKCHDLRHQMRYLMQSADGPEKERYLHEMEDAVMIYDTALKTGNSALDIVLMEKGLFCKNHNIQWTCMADGAKLDFMKPEDIYALFGNGLDNAISAVMELKDPQKRVISVKVLTQDKLLMIQIRNYFGRPLSFKDGLPQTTQDNRTVHGYGMKSMRSTAEKYNGTLSVSTEDHIFNLQILFPL